MRAGNARIFKREASYLSSARRRRDVCRRHWLAQRWRMVYMIAPAITASGMAKACRKLARVLLARACGNLSARLRDRPAAASYRGAGHYARGRSTDASMVLMCWPGARCSRRKRAAAQWYQHHRGNIFSLRRASMWPSVHRQKRGNHRRPA